MSNPASPPSGDEAKAIAEANKRIVNYGLVALVIVILGFMGWGVVQFALLILR